MSATDDACQQFWMHLWKVGPKYWNPKGVHLISKQIVFKWLRKNKNSGMISMNQEFAFLQILDEFDSDRTFFYSNWEGPGTRKIGIPCSREQINELAPDVSKISDIVSKLPGEQRVVFSFRYQMHGHEELTFREIAQRMGITIGQAAYLFYQAKKNIKKMLNC